MKKFLDIILIVTFMLIIIFVPIKTKLQPHKDYSLIENRMFEAVPEFSTAALFEGSYLPKWDDYFSDQIFKRDEIMEAYTYMQMNILNKVVVNDVIIQNNALIPMNKFTDGPLEDYSHVLNDTEDQMSSLNSLVEGYGGKFIYVGIPEQRSVLRSKYPTFLNNNDAKLNTNNEMFFNTLDKLNIDYVNMKNAFIEKSDYFSYYSRTDHHYTYLGAYMTYLQLMQKINEDLNTPLPIFENERDFEFVALDNPFLGSHNKKLYNVYNSNERIYYYKEKQPILYEKFENGEPDEAKVFYLPENPNDLVSYNIYMNGDIAETIIKTNRDELPNLLMYGDSFTNPLETFLYHSFNESVFLDLRHYKERTLLEYIEEYKPDYVICLRDDTAYFLLDGNGLVK